MLLVTNEQFQKFSLRFTFLNEPIKHKRQTTVFSKVTFVITEYINVNGGDVIRYFKIRFLVSSCFCVAVSGLTFPCACKAADINSFSCAHGLFFASFLAWI
jgi:hypothetical protein